MNKKNFKIYPTRLDIYFHVFLTKRNTKWAKRMKRTHFSIRKQTLSVSINIIHIFHSEPNLSISEYWTHLDRFILKTLDLRLEVIKLAFSFVSNAFQNFTEKKSDEQLLMYSSHSQFHWKLTIERNSSEWVFCSVMPFSSFLEKSIRKHEMRYISWP